VRVGRITIKNKYSGYLRSVLNGAMHAYCCDADYYVYVEQDCLVRGEQFLEHAVAGTSLDILIGERTQGGTGLHGRPANPMFQNSLIVVKREGLERFMSRLLDAPWSDGELSGEIIMERQLVPFEVVAVPYGRSRPIDFSTSHFYAQHLSDEELTSFLEVEGLPGAAAGGIFRER
jgi:hypothetical protein